MTLDDIAKYKTIYVKYSWDDWDFPDYPGYRKCLLKYDATSIWHDDDYWIINFHPTTYDVFVSKKYQPEQISIGWFLKVVEDRDITININSDSNKSDIFDMIVKSVNHLFD